jgi:hypothetical protein
MRTCEPRHVPAVRALLARFGLELKMLDAGAAIPGSYWGAPEAGLVGATVHARADTPLHSALHEAAHAICMDSARGAALHTDAGGDYAEENAVCYLQILLARALGVEAADICADMDAWGYTFRLGSAHAWFTADADDARAWLLHHHLMTARGELTWRRRAAPHPGAHDAGVHAANP